MKENRKLLKEVLKDIQHDMTDEEVLNLLADSKISETPPRKNTRSGSVRRMRSQNLRAAGRSSFRLRACCFCGWSSIQSYQAKTGLDTTGFTMSLYVFPIQLGIAISSGLANWLLAGMGYEAGMTMNAAQTASLQNIILLIPGLMCLAALAANILYPLGQKKMGEVYGKLNAAKKN